MLLFFPLGTGEICGVAKGFIARNFMKLKCPWEPCSQSSPYHTNDMSIKSLENIWAAGKQVLSWHGLILWRTLTFRTKDMNGVVISPEPKTHLSCAFILLMKGWRTDQWILVIGLSPQVEALPSALMNCKKHICKSGLCSCLWLHLDFLSR